MLATVKCPNCAHMFVVNSQGRCKCGAYLIVGWAGMNRGARILMPEGPVWVKEDGQWREMEVPCV